MIMNSWLDVIPLPLVFVLTVVFFFLCIYLGMWLHAFLKEKSDESDSIGSVVGATLGLLAFMLAFTFNMTANRFELRNQLLLDEVSAVGTTYLRAGLLPQPYAGQIRTLLRNYVNLRTEGMLEPERILDVLSQSEMIQDQLWSEVEKLTVAVPPSVNHSLFVSSLNEMIDFYGKRVAVGKFIRIPWAIWLGLYSISALAMIVVGYQFGQTGRRRLLFNLVLTMAFSSVILLIVDLDRVWEGAVQIDQQPFFELREQVQKDY